MKKVLSLILVSAIFTGCPSRQEIEAAAWLNNGLPPELCEKQPDLKNYGFYRKLNDGKLEFVAFCSPQSRHWIAFFDEDLKRLLDATVK